MLKILIYLKSVETLVEHLGSGDVKLFRGSQVLDLAACGLELDACCLGLEACGLLFESLGA